LNESWRLRLPKRGFLQSINECDAADIVEASECAEVIFRSDWSSCRPPRKDRDFQQVKSFLNGTVADWSLFYESATTIDQTYSQRRFRSRFSNFLSSLDRSPLTKLLV
jgi:hypothetical protein